MQLGCERREDRGGILKYSLRKWLKKTCYGGGIIKYSLRKWLKKHVTEEVFKRKFLSLQSQETYICLWNRTL